MDNQPGSTLIVGMGEIGTSLYNILKEVYPTWGVDLDEAKSKMDKCPEQVEVMHICIRYSDKFLDIVDEYGRKYRPKLLDICSTVPPGTCEKMGMSVCHSTTRGLHPNLEEGLKTITKHIGGGRSIELAGYFAQAGIPCYTHPRSKTTELLHLANNTHYALNVVFADEMSKIFRSYGVDYWDYLKYTESNNAGFSALGHATKVRTIATPPNGKVGGHCIIQSANLIPEDRRGTLTNFVAHFNDDK